MIQYYRQNGEKLTVPATKFDRQLRRLRNKNRNSLKPKVSSATILALLGMLAEVREETKQPNIYERMKI